MRAKEILDEITRPSSINHAEQILRNAGYRSMGTGVSGRVFNKPGADHVLKLFNITDVAYTNFVNLAQRSNNVHFPKFKGKLIKVNDEYNAVQMEKLMPVPDTSGSYFPSCFVKSPPYKSYEVAKMLDRYLRMLVGRPAYYGDPTETIVEKRLNELERDQPGITEACNLIASIVDGDVDIDLHSFNMMLRGNTLVITDPIVSN